MPLGKKLIAEFLGTFWLVFGGCGSAVFAAMFFAGNTQQTQLGIGFVGVSLAFGLTVMTMAYAIGHISGCHLNPAVSIGLMVGGRFKSAELLPYIIAQVLGATAAAGMLYVILTGQPGFGLKDAAGVFATNGFDDYSPGKYSMTSALLAEVILTFFFLLIILGSTDKRAPAGMAPMAIGLGLTLIHLVGIPITNLSVNPARSTGPALIAAQVTQVPLKQLWLFWAAPIAGAILAGIVYKLIAHDDDKPSA